MSQLSQVRVMQAGGSKTFGLSKQTLVLSAQENTQYQLLSQNGALIVEPHTKLVGQDLWVFAEKTATEPTLILRNYSAFSPIVDTNTLMEMNASLAVGANGATPMIPVVAENAPVLAQEVSTLSATSATPVTTAKVATTSSSGFSTGAVIGLGVLAMGGIAVAAAGGGGGSDASASSSSNNTSNTNTSTSSGSSSSGSSNNPVVVVPVTPVVKVNAITADNIINRAESGQALTVSGTVQYANAGDKVQISVAGQTFDTTLNTAGTFSTSIAGSVLAQAQQLTASVQTTSNGQTVTGSTQHTYTVDTTINQPIITLNAITGDNVLTATETSGNITVSGTVTHANVGDKITLTVGDVSQTATLVSGQNGLTFSTSFAGSHFITNTQINANISTQDSAGNTATASNSLTYSLDISTFKPSISLNNVTADNLVTTAESQSHITISGKTLLVADGTTVNIKIGTSTFTTTVKDNAFSYAVAGDVVANNTEVSASIAVSYAGINETITANKTYEFRDTASIVTIEHVDSDNIIGAEQTEGLSRLNGSLDASELTAKWRKQGMLRTITLNIGDKSYEVALAEDLTFHVDIPNSELVNLAGQSISYSLSALEEYQIFSLTTSGYGVVSTGTLTGTTKITLNSTDGIITGSNNQYSIANSDTLLEKLGVTVNGTVAGTASVGDTVQLTVNNQTYQATVQSDKTFSTKVSVADLQADSDSIIEASISGKDGSDSASYLVAPSHDANNATFVSANGEISANQLPYFINALNALPIAKTAGYSVGILDAHQIGTSINIRYHFPTQAELDNMTNSSISAETRAITHGFDTVFYESRLSDLEISSPVTYSATNQAIIKEILADISQYANITFTEVSSTAESDIDFYMMNTNAVSAESAGFAYYGNDVHLNKDLFTGIYTLENNDGRLTATHEILHAFGLKHPHREADEDSSVPALPTAQDSNGVTIMSYNVDDYVNVNAPHLYDLATLHYFYGVSTNTRTGNDTYTFRTYNPATVDGDVYIWDGAGVDTFNASEETQGVNVNLTPGSWIYADANISSTDALGLISKTQLDYTAYSRGLADKAPTDIYVYTYDFTDDIGFIGYGTQIENLIGSSYNDILTGNDANNVITGGAGDDTINGGKGNDYLDGGAGTDTLIGGVGDDIYVIDGNDTITETNNGGNDTVYALADFTLGNYLENLTLIGNAQTATGNSQNNIIIGNEQDNVINGGAGKDTLTGGTGADQFVFSSLLSSGVDVITDFTVGEDTIVLSQSIFTSLDDTISDFANYIQYNSQTGALSYDSDGTGSGSSVQFATLQTGLGDLGAENFTLIA